jgi:hypothetical protein
MITAITTTEIFLTVPMVAGRLRRARELIFKAA